MTNTELVRQLRTASVQCDEMRLRDFGYLMKTAADKVDDLLNIISHLQTLTDMMKDTMSEWISVNERLPEKHKRVFVCTRSKAIGIDFVSTDGNWYTTGGVTHWMPLPNPPHERKEE